MEHASNATNSTISGGASGDNSVDAKIVAPLVAAVGLVLVLVGVIAVQVGRAYRNRRSKVYDVSSKANSRRKTKQQLPISINTELSIEDILEDDSGQPSNISQSTEQLIQQDDNRCASFTIQSDIAVAEVHATESPGGVSVLSLQEWDESHESVEQSSSRSERHNIPRANPLRLKRKNKIFPMAEESSFASSITDEELIIIGTAIKSCPNLGRESPVLPAEQDEPCETVSYPTLLQTDEQQIMSSSFQLFDASSSSAVDNFCSQSSGEDVPCSKVVQRKDLWTQEDIVSGDVFVIDN